MKLEYGYVQRTIRFMAAVQRKRIVNKREDEKKKKKRNK